MLNAIKHLWLGVTLIAAASAVLLLSDLNRRQGRGPSRDALPRIAVMQFTSTQLLDDTVSGMLDRLREGGYEDGRTANIRIYNASGDYGTATSMAREIVGGGYAIILTASTPALQVMAAANRTGNTVHVFGGVTDPYGSGVNITGPEPDQHPPHLVGVGTFQPVENAFAIAHAMRPALRRVGVVWNPTEHNSEACVLKAREKCLELGIELLEANAGNTSEVPDAVRSVLARGAEAIWIGGDTVATASVSAILGAARGANVPVFTNDPTDAQKGALFGLGASYFEVGRAASNLAVQILQGADPTSFRVENIVPERLGLNESVLDHLKEEWIIPDAVQQRARESAEPQAQARRPTPGRVYKVGLLYFMPDPIFEMATEGLRRQLQELGFVEGENLALTVAHANGDMSMLPQVTRSLAESDIDLLTAFSTPCLASALAVAKNMPIVFGIVTSPIQAGAGESFENHLPHVTGAVWTAPHPEIFKWMQVLAPEARALGVIHNPAEANSVHEVAVIREACEAMGVNLVVRTVAVSSDMPMAIQSLLAADVDVVFSIADNTASRSIGALAEACRRNGIILMSDDNSMMGSGALFSCGASPEGEGRHTARLVARVLLGEDPANIPFSPSQSMEIAVDMATASHLGITIPDEMLLATDIFYNVKDRLGRPLQVALINSAHNDLLDQAETGLEAGLALAGLRSDVDYILRRFNAEGDMTQLPQIVDAARALSPDLILTVSTPALMATAHRAGDTPIVYAVASNPFDIGLFAQGRPSNITGVHEGLPMEQLMAMAHRGVAGLKVVGAIHDPSQPNSELAMARLREVCEDQGIGLVEATASTVSELPAATQSVLQRGAQALLLSADNLIATGFPAIVRSARSAGVPVYTTEPGQVAQGAAGAVGHDYGEWGIEAGRMAAKVLAGLAPSELPLQTPSTLKTVEAPTGPLAAPPALPQRKRILRMVGYSDTHFTEATHDGLLEGLRQAGWEADRDYDFKYFNAQGDMATLSSIMTSVCADDPDVILAISTPALQAALRQAGGRTVVFCSVGDAVLAGAGKSETDHLPNVTGITTRSAFKEMAELIRKLYPDAKAMGTLFTPGEVNSVLYRDLLEEALRAQGIALISRPVNAPMETAEATMSLLNTDIQAVCQIVDNTVRPGFAQITRRAATAGLPVLSFDSATLAEGAALVIACDYYEAGVEAGLEAARILQGESPADIPFRNTRNMRLMINEEAVQKLGMRLPDSIVQQAAAQAGS